MNKERHERISALFAAAVRLPASERPTFLNTECGDDTGLISAIQSLLDNDIEDDAFLQTPALGHVAINLGRLCEPAQNWIGKQVGEFLINGVIASGGMGTVFKATQRDPHRLVALKLMRPGLMSPLAQQRFHYEAQILARLQHPNIAQVYGAGQHNEAGVSLPYFAMQFITEALPITRFVTDHRLALTHRLELLTKVCDAVHHGHQKGIVHRDLKPHNILVDASGEPKVIDYGVAKATHADMPLTLQTDARQIIGTLQYMSPEQVSADRYVGGDLREVDVRTDVYALGMVLYELLCDRLPYDVSHTSIPEAMRIIREQSPPRPSVHAAVLRGDLDTIVLKAMDKDLARRYQSAHDLARDLRHYLAGEPIEARRDSTWYIVRRTIGRHRLPLAAAVAFLILIVASSVIAWTLLIRSQRAELTARVAHIQAVDNLLDALLAQARASRKTGWIGQRLNALAAVERAAAIRPSPELRNEAIAAMALFDLRPVPPKLSHTGLCSFDNSMRRCQFIDRDHRVTIVNIADDAVVAVIPLPDPGMTPIQEQLIDRYFIRLLDKVGLPRRVDIWRIPEVELATQVEVSESSGFDVSDDQQRIAVKGRDGAVHIYDLESGTEVQRVPTDSNHSRLKFDHTGRFLAQYGGHDTDTPIHDLRTGEVRRVLEGVNTHWAVVWSPDDRILAGAEANSVALWDMQSARIIDTLRAHEQTVVGIGFQSGGNVMWTSSWEGVTNFWDVRTRQALLHARGGVCGQSPDGRRFALRAPDEADGASLFEWQGGTEFCRLVGTEDTSAASSDSGAFDSTGDLLIVTSPTPLGLRVFDIRLQKEIAAAPIGPIGCSCFDPHGRFVITSGVRGLEQWPIERAAQHLKLGPPKLLRSDGDIKDMDLSADGRILALTRLYDTSHFTIMDLSQPDSVRNLACLPNAQNIALSHDGRWVALCTWGGAGAEIWDVATGQRVAQLPFQGNATVRFTPDGSRLFISESRGLCVWDTQSWKLIRCVSGEAFRPLTFSPDGRLLFTMDSTARIRLIDAVSLEEVAALESPEQGAWSSIAVNKDGNLLAVFTLRNHVIQLWDLRSVRKQLAAMNLDWRLTGDSNRGNADLDTSPFQEPPLAPSANVIDFDLGRPIS